jgi:hypothetical protein
MSKFLWLDGNILISRLFLVFKCRNFDTRCGSSSGERREAYEALLMVGQGFSPKFTLSDESRTGGAVALPDHASRQRLRLNQRQVDALAFREQTLAAA